MLKDMDLTIGKSYVQENTQAAFEVIELFDYRVTYKAYDLITGKLCAPRRECNRFDFLRMVDRAATQAEMANFQTAAPTPGNAAHQRKEIDPRLEELKHIQNINIAQ